jgi:hypothetical protein
MHSEAADCELEFPDGAEFNPPPRRMEPAAALRLCEGMFASFRRSALDRETRRDRPKTEFDLANPVSGPENYPAELLDELLRGH